MGVLPLTPLWSTTWGVPATSASPYSGRGGGGGKDHRQAHVPDFQFLCCLLQRAGVGTLNLGHGPASFTVNWQQAMTRGWWNPADERSYVGKLQVPCLQQVRPIPNPPNSPQPPNPNSSPGGTMYSGPAPAAPAPAAVAPRARRTPARCGGRR